MADQSLKVRHANPADHHMIARAELVNVKTEAGAYVIEARQVRCLRSCEIGSSGEFHVPDLAVERANPKPRPFSKRGIIGKALKARSLSFHMGGEHLLERERLWCLRQPQLRAIESPGDVAEAVDRFYGIAGDNDGNCGSSNLGRVDSS